MLPLPAVDLVPTARLELAQLSPLPPQDSVSTNFTTTAVFVLPGWHEEPREVLAFRTALEFYPEMQRFRALRQTARRCTRYLVGICAAPEARRGRRRRRRSRAGAAGCRGRNLRCGAAGAARVPAHRSRALEHAAAARCGDARGRSRPAASVQTKNTAAQDRRGARQEVGAAGGAEQAARGAAAEGSAHVGALAVLDQDQADHRQCGEHLHDQHDG